MEPKRKWVLLASVVAIFILIFFGVERYRAIQQEIERHETEARASATALIAKASEKLVTVAALASTSPPPSAEVPAAVIDIDKSFRLLHLLDVGARDCKNLEDYVDLISRQDYVGVDPQACSIRKQMLDALVPLAIRTRGLSAREDLWWSYRALLLGTAAANSLTIQASVSGPLLPSASIGTKANEETRRSAVENLRENLEKHESLLNDIENIKTDLLKIVDKSVPVCERISNSWQNLCLIRDAAYLAAAKGDWAACERHALEAMKLSPSEIEAHLLFALAKLEQSGTSMEERVSPLRLTSDPTPATPSDVPIVRGEDDLTGYLSRFIQDHPDYAAPALVLRGMYHGRRGRLSEAHADLTLASTRYPLQAQRLQDQFDPYRIRGYLRHTSAGRLVTGQYESMMLGAGTFSPELQLARLEASHLSTGMPESHIEQPSREEGHRRVQALVREHFLRRRHGQSWTQVLYDVDFCENLLSADFRATFPEASFLDLELSVPGTVSDFFFDADVLVRNRSDRALHNVLVVLCLRFTDMHPSDYVAVPVHPTIPLVPKGESKLGTVPTKIRAIGIERTLKDLVEPIRAIVFSDEATFRLDTSEFRLQRATEMARLQSSAERSSEKHIIRSSEAARRAAFLMGTGASVTLESSLFGDSKLIVEVDRGFAYLGSVLSLRIGQREFRSEADGLVSEVAEKKLRLTVKSANLPAREALTQLEIRAQGLDVALCALIGKEADGSWKIQSISE